MKWTKVNWAKRVLAPCLLVGLAFGASNARAQSFLELSGVTANLTTGANQDVLGHGLAFSVGTLILDLAAGETATMTYSFVGKEAGYLNGFFRSDKTFAFDNRSAPGTGFIDVVSKSGALDFGFSANGLGAVFSNAANSFCKMVNFGVILDSSRRSGYLLLDDGGAGPDYDYDDMVVRFNLTVVPVPEPGTWAMLIAGAGLMAGIAVRRRRAQFKALA